MWFTLLGTKVSVKKNKQKKKHIKWEPYCSDFHLTSIYFPVTGWICRFVFFFYVAHFIISSVIIFFVCLHCILNNNNNNNNVRVTCLN